MKELYVNYDHRTKLTQLEYSLKETAVRLVAEKKPLPEIHQVLEAQLEEWKSTRAKYQNATTHISYCPTVEITIRHAEFQAKILFSIY